jgi:hypothetical protein
MNGASGGQMPASLVSNDLAVHVRERSHQSKAAIQISAANDRCEPIAAMPRFQIVQMQQLGLAGWPKRHAALQPGKRPFVLAAASFMTPMTELRDSTAAQLAANWRS